MLDVNVIYLRRLRPGILVVVNHLDRAMVIARLREQVWGIVGTKYLIIDNRSLLYILHLRNLPLGLTAWRIEAAPDSPKRRLDLCSSRGANSKPIEPVLPNSLREDSLRPTLAGWLLANCRKDLLVYARAWRFSVSRRSAWGPSATQAARYSKARPLWQRNSQNPVLPLRSVRSAPNQQEIFDCLANW
jgi:hypothetical protein